MSVSISTSSVSDLSKIGWKVARLIEREGFTPAYNPAGVTFAAGLYVAGVRAPEQLQKFYDATIDELVADQGGTATTTNVNNALKDSATPAAAATTILAL